MGESNKTFMFIYGSMHVGGVELYLIRTIRKLQKNGNRIVWLTPPDSTIDETLVETLTDRTVERIDITLNDFNQISQLPLEFADNEKVAALAFNIITFMQLEMLKKKYHSAKIDNFFWVSHFQDLFIEELLIKPLQPAAKKFMGKIISSMEQNNNIIYANKSHLDAFVSRYNLQIEHPEKKMVKFNKEIIPFSEEIALKRSMRYEFNIITIGRFDFPHKGYIVGLISEYGKLKSKYEHLKLTIIGYGKDEDQVILELNKLTPAAKRDVHLAGKVSYDDLQGYFENAHLNIGVAGTISDGALTGLISIPVRHYSEKCEGYGYLPESKFNTVSNHPGIPIEHFIEEVILMNQEKYLDLSRKAYDAYANNDQNNTLSVLENENKYPGQTLPNKVINIFKLYRGIRRILKRQ